MMLKPKDLRLRDKVRLGSGCYMDGTVFQIKDEIVKIFRPYIHTSEMATTSGVITYIGHEIVQLWIGDNREVDVLEREATI